MQGETYTTAHGDAIQQGEVGLRVGCDGVVKSVFQGEVIGTGTLTLICTIAVRKGLLRHLISREDGERGYIPQHPADFVTRVPPHPHQRKRHGQPL